MKRRNYGMSSYWYFGMSVFWGLLALLWAVRIDEPLIAAIYLVCSLLYLVGGFVWKSREEKQKEDDGQIEGGNET
ncbi:MAG: hypothetical protein MJ070_10580 [Lachnospiraceae bacterium]|nr:hypothetical protein [Lachnospiraceae bacterium]